MNREATIGIKGASPRFRSAKEELPALSREYIEIRNRSMLAKAKAAEMDLAIRRNELIVKSLVEKQAAYLLVALRQKILSIPQGYARRFLGLTEVAQSAKLLSEMARSVLSETSRLPEQVTDPEWLEKLEAEETRAGWRAQKRR